MFHFGFKDPRKEHVYTRVYPALSRATAAESLSEMILIEWTEHSMRTLFSRLQCQN